MREVVGQEQADAEEHDDHGDRDPVEPVQLSVHLPVGNDLGVVPRIGLGGGVERIPLRVGAVTGAAAAREEQARIRTAMIDKCFIKTFLLCDVMQRQLMGNTTRMSYQYHRHSKPRQSLAKSSRNLTLRDGTGGGCDNFRPRVIYLLVILPFT